jgi:hypothetical protein
MRLDRERLAAGATQERDVLVGASHQPARPGFDRTAPTMPTLVGRPEALRDAAPVMRSHPAFEVPERGVDAVRGYVVMPVGGEGASMISTARRGTQPLGGRSSQKTQIAWAVGLAALGASTPCHPSRQSVSPTC